jgi:hypothetical protein
MSTRTQQLDALMKKHSLTAREVGDLIGREPHTVRCWRSAWEGRVIPEHTLEVLKMKIEARARGAK